MNNTYEVSTIENTKHVSFAGQSAVAFPQARYANERNRLEVKPKGGWRAYRKAAIDNGGLDPKDKVAVKLLQKQYNDEKKARRAQIAIVRNSLAESGMMQEQKLELWESKSKGLCAAWVCQSKEEKLPEYSTTKRENNEDKFKRMAEKFGCTPEEVKAMWNK